MNFCSLLSSLWTVDHVSQLMSLKLKSPTIHKIQKNVAGTESRKVAQYFSATI